MLTFHHYIRSTGILKMLYFCQYITKAGLFSSNCCVCSTVPTTVSSLILVNLFVCSDSPSPLPLNMQDSRSAAFHMARLYNSPSHSSAHTYSEWHNLQHLKRSCLLSPKSLQVLGKSLQTGARTQLYFPHPLQSLSQNH